jgi:hypothetical protein
MIIFDCEIFESVGDHGNIDSLHLLHLLGFVFYLRTRFVFVLGLDLKRLILGLTELAGLSQISLLLLTGEIVLGKLLPSCLFHLFLFSSCFFFLF